MKEDEGLLNAKDLLKMQFYRPDISGYLYYIAKLRLGLVFFMALGAATCLARFLACTFAIWFGIGYGVFLKAAMLRYGLKGVILLQAAMFPQMGFYLPAFFILFEGCLEMNDIIMRRKSYTSRYLLVKMGTLLFLLLSGILLEVLLGPCVLRMILKIL